MPYALVLQLPIATLRDYDHMIELEERLMDHLAYQAEVDGHDAGSGEGNIFIHTDDAVRTFERIRAMPGIDSFLPRLTVAYRDMAADAFIILHPPDAKHFGIK